MNFTLRERKRIPYEDVLLPGDSSSESSTDDEFIPTSDLFDGRLEGNERSNKRNGDSKNSNRSSKKFKVKLDFISIGQANKIRTTSDNPRTHFSPNGKQVRCVQFREIQDKILNPEKYFLPNEQGINVLMPIYDPTSPNTPQYFGIESQNPIFDFPLIRNMSDKDIDSELSEIEKEIEEGPEFEEQYVLVSPYDPNIVHSISIRQNVNNLNWEKIIIAAGHFDVILMDPPWKIQDTLNPTRGLSLDYEQMDDNEIGNMNIECLQKNGFLFIWVVAAKIQVATIFLEKWGYKIVNFVNWVKITRNGFYAPSNGHYLQHVKETCIVAKKGYGFDGMNMKYFSDLIVCPRNVRQSHKPIELYEMIEKCFPDGLYLEIFARAHNIREGWVSVGLEIPA